VQLLAQFLHGVPVPTALQHHDLCSCARRISNSCQRTTGSATASAFPARCARAQQNSTPCPQQVSSSHQQQLPRNNRECACQRLFRTVCPCPTHHSNPSPLQLCSYHKQQAGNYRECACQRLSTSAAGAREPQGVRLPVLLTQGVPVPTAPAHRDLCRCHRRISSSSSHGTTGSVPASASPAQCARVHRTTAPCPLQLCSSHQQRLPGNHSECAC
jgi:hypothetical protein